MYRVARFILGNVDEKTTIYQQKLNTSLQDTHCFEYKIYFFQPSIHPTYAVGQDRQTGGPSCTPPDQHLSADVK